MERSLRQPAGNTVPDTVAEELSRRKTGVQQWEQPSQFQRRPLEAGGAQEERKYGVEDQMTGADGFARFRFEAYCRGERNRYRARNGFAFQQFLRLYRSMQPSIFWRFRPPRR